MQLTSEGNRVGELAKKITHPSAEDDHFKAVQAQCAAALEVYAGILTLVAEDNGISAQSLVRTLFETIVGAVLLAKDPNKLSDFGKHAKLTLLRMSETTPEESTFGKKELTVKLRNLARSQCALLEKYFKPSSNWYRLRRKEGFAEAELPKNFYESFYIRASAIAHGDPLTVFKPSNSDLNTWVIRPMYEEWRNNWPMLAYVMSMYLMLHMIEQTSKCFNLGLNDEMASISRDVGVIAAKQMEWAKRMPDVE